MENFKYNELSMPAYFAVLDDEAMELTEGGGYVALTIKASFLRRVVSAGADAAGRIACQAAGISVNSTAGKAIRTIVSNHYSAMTRNIKDFRYSVWAPLINVDVTIS